MNWDIDLATQLPQHGRTDPRLITAKKGAILKTPLGNFTLPSIVCSYPVDKLWSRTDPALAVLNWKGGHMIRSDQGLSTRRQGRKRERACERSCARHTWESSSGFSQTSSKISRHFCLTSGRLGTHTCLRSVGNRFVSGIIMIGICMPEG